jgi:hypothetical protein
MFLSQINKFHDECLDYGVVRQAGPGTFTLLPLGLRAFNKLCRLIGTRFHTVPYPHEMMRYCNVGFLSDWSLKLLGQNSPSQYSGARSGSAGSVKFWTVIICTDPNPPINKFEKP